MTLKTFLKVWKKGKNDSKDHLIVKTVHFFWGPIKTTTIDKPNRRMEFSQLTREVTCDFLLLPNLVEKLLFLVFHSFLLSFVCAAILPQTWSLEAPFLTVHHTQSISVLILRNRWTNCVGYHALLRKLDLNISIDFLKQF